jgi:hypothetical protein
VPLPNVGRNVTTFCYKNATFFFDLQKITEAVSKIYAFITQRRKGAKEIKKFSACSMIFETVSNRLKQLPLVVAAVIATSEEYV